MKIKKTLALILATVSIATLFAGCKDKKSSGETTATAIIATTKKVEFNTDSLDDLKLEKIEISQTDTASWAKRETYNTLWTVTATYDAANETVSEVTISIEIPKTSKTHDSTVKKYENAKTNLDKINDPNISAAFNKANDSTTVEMKFSALNEADRAKRVACIEGLLDIEADEDHSFSYNSLDAGLILRSFKLA